jgi:hypothetical protein
VYPLSHDIIIYKLTAEWGKKSSKIGKKDKKKEFLSMPVEATRRIMPLI